MFHGFSLTHDPQEAPSAEMGEGMPVAGLGIGYYASFALTVLSLLSALVSMMPFKFNKRLEESIDKRFETSKKQISKVGHGINDEIHKIGHRQDKHEKAVATDAATTTPEEEKVNVEDESRFMPKGEDASTSVAGDDSRFMPARSPQEEKYSDYMPK